MLKEWARLDVQKTLQSAFLLFSTHDFHKRQEVTSHLNAAYKGIFQKERDMVSPGTAKQQPTQLQERMCINKGRIQMIG